MSEVLFKIANKQAWIKVTHGRHDETVESKLQFIANLYNKTDIVEVEIKVIRV